MSVVRAWVAAARFMLAVGASTGLLCTVLCCAALRCPPLKGGCIGWGLGTNACLDTCRSAKEA